MASSTVSIRWNWLLPTFTDECIVNKQLILIYKCLPFRTWKWQLEITISIRITFALRTMLGARFIVGEQQCGELLKCELVFPWKKCFVVNNSRRAVQWEIYSVPLLLHSNSTFVRIPIDTNCKKNPFTFTLSSRRRHSYSHEWYDSYCLFRHHSHKISTIVSKLVKLNKKWKSIIEHDK